MESILTSPEVIKTLGFWGILIAIVLWVFKELIVNIPLGNMTSEHKYKLLKLLISIVGGIGLLFSLASFFFQYQNIDTTENQIPQEEIQKAHSCFGAKNYSAALNIYKKYKNYSSFDSDCAYKLGKCFYVEKKYSDALKWLRKSAEQGNAFGENGLGSMYYQGHGVNQDYAEALKWYRKATKQENPLGQVNLGIMYMKGYGVAQNYTEALNLYRKSAEQGNELGQFCLGLMYKNGYSVTQDYVEALKWFRKSAEQGNDFAQAKLGEMYELGEGVIQSTSGAIYWYERAAAQGNKNAINSLKKLGSATAPAKH